MDCPYHNICTSKDMCLMVRRQCDSYGSVCKSIYRETCRKKRFFEFCPIGYRCCNQSLVESFNMGWLKSIGFIP